MKICFGHLTGSCKHCTEDLDPNHHPNNRDCIYFHEIELSATEDDGVTVITPRKDGDKQYLAPTAKV